MISKTKLKIRSRKKTNQELAETIFLARKNANWMQIARVLSGSTRKHSAINLREIDEKSEIGDTFVIPGKILSEGELSKKIKICAFKISKEAKEKLKHTKSEFVFLIDEIKKNPKAEGIKIIQ